MVEKQSIKSVLFGLAVFVICSQCSIMPSPTPSKSTTTSDTDTQEPTVEAIPAQGLLTESELEALIDGAVDGRFKELIFDSEGKQGVLYVSWDLQGFYTNELIADGAKNDTVAILRTLVDSNTEFDEVLVSAWYPMTVDTNNTLEDTEVIRLYYDKPTLEGRNWETIRSQFIWLIADRGYVRKELGG